MRLRVLGLVACAALITAAQPATAQQIVHDPTSLAKQLAEYKSQLTELRSQVENGRRMITQGEQLFDSFNEISNIGDLGRALDNPSLRQFMPEDTRALSRAMNGDWEALGQVGDRALAIRNDARAWTPDEAGATDADRSYREGLDRRGNMAARDIAVGEHIDQTASNRLEGIGELRRALDTADSARAVMDIQARLAAESAMIANDNMRLQGMAMRAQAERELEAQRYEEAQQARRTERRRSYERIIGGRAQ